MHATMPRKAKEPTTSRSYRLPERIAAALEQLADENRRSTNAELLIAIENHLRANGVLPAPAPKPKPPKK